MRYKLLKELPGCKKWTIFDEDGFFIEWEMEESVDDTIDVHFIDKFKHNKEWFEEIKEVKSIYDLKEWDTYFYIDSNSNVSEREDVWYSVKDIFCWNAFLTKEEAETELQKRKDIAEVNKYMYNNKEDHYLIGLIENINLAEEVAIKYVKTEKN